MLGILPQPYHETHAPKPRPRTGDDLWKSDTLHRPLHASWHGDHPGAHPAKSWMSRDKPAMTGFDFGGCERQRPPRGGRLKVHLPAEVWQGRRWLIVRVLVGQD